MITPRVRVNDETHRVIKAAKAGTITSLGRAGAYIRGIAMRSIKVSPDPAPPGHQPHTRKGRLKRGILFAVDRAALAALIGPTASAVGMIGRTHEFGGTEPPKRRRGRRKRAIELGGYGPIRVEGRPVYIELRTPEQVSRAQEVAATLTPAERALGATSTRRYPARPFMGPALERAKPRLPALWANSVKGR
jgi:hypothetical protein